MAFSLPDVAPQILDKLLSPSILLFADRVKANVDAMVNMAGSAGRLRPHCKTHKMDSVIRLLLERGITHHKAATFAEAEMLAEAGVSDIVLAYNMVGPNVARAVTFRQRYPQISFSVTADDEHWTQQLAEAAANANTTIGVMLDLNVGLNRTGLAPGSDSAVSVYKQISGSAGLKPAGFHIYDGHQRQSDLQERSTAVRNEWPAVIRLKQALESEGLAVPELLCGGTPTFPVYTEFTEPEIMLSPGTGIFHDAGYGSKFADLSFVPAAAVVTRIISRPQPDRITLDLGSKSVAADPPKGQRVYFPALPDAEQVIHNEEHLVLRCDSANEFAIGDAILGIPMHVCPTSALHDTAAVIEDGALSTPWKVTARNRRISI